MRASKQGQVQQAAQRPGSTEGPPQISTADNSGWAQAAVAPLVTRPAPVSGSNGLRLRPQAQKACGGQAARPIPPAGSQPTSARGQGPTPIPAIRRRVAAGGWKDEHALGRPATIRSWRLSRRPCPSFSPALKGSGRVVRQRRLALKTSPEAERRQGRWDDHHQQHGPPPATGYAVQRWCQPRKNQSMPLPRGIMPQPHHQAIGGPCSLTSSSPTPACLRTATRKEGRQSPGGSGLAGSPAGFVTKDPCWCRFMHEENRSR